MIVVEVELHPGGDWRRASVTALVVVWNDQTGTATVGNYRYAIAYPATREAAQGSRPPGWAVTVAESDPPGWTVHRGRVEGVPRTDPTNLNVVAAVIREMP